MYKGELPPGIAVHTLQSASDAGLDAAFKGRPSAPSDAEGDQDIYSLGARSILEEAVRSIPSEVLASMRGFQISVLA